MNNSNDIVVYTDGGCWGNPGPGAWACYIMTPSRFMAIAEGEPDTTNNKMELSAAIGALEAIIQHPNWSDKHIIMYSDSQYLVNGITSWIKGWKANGWKHGKVKNVDLWRKLDDLNHKLKVDWYWVKGHAGNKYNEICDQMCQNKISEVVKNCAIN